LNPDPILRAAQQSPLGRAYLDWSPVPFLDVSDVSQDTDADGSPRGAALPHGYHLVTFRDPRFMGDTLLLHFSGRTPITGEVELDEKNRVVRQSMDGKDQH